MTAKATLSETLSTMLTGQWEQAGPKLTALAEEFPAERYDWRPAEGVRTFADVLRHVAFWNRYVAAVAGGKEADDQANELPKTEFSSKAKIVAALRESLEEATKALTARREGLDPKAAETLVSFIGHTSEHYGQLVVYARLNGIVPPASRG